MTFNSQVVETTPEVTFFVTCGLSHAEGGEERRRDGAVYFLSETEKVYSISTCKPFTGKKRKTGSAQDFK